MEGENVFPLQTHESIAKDSHLEPPCSKRYEYGTTFMCYRTNNSRYFLDIKSLMVTFNFDGGDNYVYRCWVENKGNKSEWREDCLAYFTTKNTYTRLCLLSPAEGLVIGERRASYPNDFSNMEYGERYENMDIDEMRKILADVQKYIEVIDDYISKNKESIIESLYNDFCKGKDFIRNKGADISKKVETLENVSVYTDSFLDPSLRLVPSLRFTDRKHFYDSIVAAIAKNSGELRRDFPFIERFNNNGSFTVAPLIKTEDIGMQQAVVNAICESIDKATFKNNTQYFAVSSEVYSDEPDGYTKSMLIKRIYNRRHEK